MNNYYTFRAEAVEEPENAELLIFDVIGNWEDIGEVSAKGFARDLAKLPTSVKRLEIHINSPGGSVFDASAIYSRLADHRSEKIVYIDGLAASAASIVAMVGHKIYIRANANMMIHLPSGLAVGNADDMRAMAGALDSITESMVNVYQKKTNRDREEIRALMAAETWMSPQQALEQGFADEMRGVIKAAAMVDNKRAVFNGVEFDLSRFHNVPTFGAQQQARRETPMAAKPKVTATTKEAEEETPTPPAEQPTPPATKEPKPPPPQDPEKEKEEEAACPAAADADAEYQRGVRAERGRIAALQKYDRPHTHDLIVKAIAEGKTVEDITEQLFSALEKGGQQAARRADANALNEIPATDGGADGGDASQELGGRLKKAVKARLKARGQRFPVQQGRN
jgi:ATP-dependent protease ClpP protease subunit